ncbi:MAG: hemerythrin domain-containing protein [Bacteroidia bacterium]
MENKLTTLLYAEHDNILKLKEIISKIDLLWEQDSKKYEDILNTLIHFFRNYADKLHHHKEEDILFPALCDINPMLEQGIVDEMLEHHEIFRELIGSIETHLKQKEYASSYKELCKYFELLEDHIQVENNELFPLAEDLLNSNEHEKLYFKAIDYHSENNDLLKNLEEIFNTLKSYKDIAAK